MTAYEWDEVRMRERIEALGLILAFDLNDRNHFAVLNTNADQVAVIISTPSGFECLTQGPDHQHYAVNTPTSEQNYFTALAQLTGATV